MAFDRPDSNGSRAAPVTEPPAQTDGSPLSDGRERADPLTALAEGIAELRFEIRRLAQAKFDLAKLKVRNGLIAVVAGIAGGVIVMSIAIVSAAFLVYGVAGGLGKLFGDRAWLGFLLAGLGFLLALALGGIGFEWRARARARRGLEKKYARPSAELSAEHREAANA